MVTAKLLSTSTLWRVLKMTNQTTEYDYLRVKITVTLKTMSPLHCGDGNTMLASEWKSRKNKTEGTINTLCKGNNNKPYIPASTLRGSLRDRYRGNDKETLFGNSHGNGSMGKIRVYDAKARTIKDINGDQYQHNDFKTTLRDGVSINAITQTAKEHHLFIHEIVPTGTAFELIMEADRISNAQLDSIIQLLQQWSGSMSCSIGKGKTKGWGRLKLASSLHIETLSDKSIQQWLSGKTATAKWEQQEKRLDSQEQQDKIVFNLYPQSPLLINDHARVKEGDTLPNLEFMRNTQGKAIIPGSSLKGAFRAHTHKIMATIAHLHYGIEAIKAAKLVEESINKLFGAERKRSLLWIEEAVDQTEGSSNKHQQFFNAVDRFTGGVAEGALFNVIAANCQKLSGECFYDKHPKRIPQGHWWKGLLLLVVRDFMQGDLALGWGKGKGYGQMLLTLEIGGNEYQTFDDLLNYLQEDKADQWIEQLHQHIEQLTKQSDTKGV